MRVGGAVMSARAIEAARAEVPVAPDAAPPRDAAAHPVWQAAVNARGARIVVSRESRALWLVGEDGVTFRAPVAVGKHEPFVYAGRRYDFQTPIMRRTVLNKGTEPLWVPPDWHYFEIAAEQDLEPVHLKKGSRVVLSDSTTIEVRGEQVGRVNRYGNFWPFTPGTEIIFDGRIFIPPIGSAQRRVPDVLGSHKLELGDGYLIHGTNANGSIGEAVSHGCVRMFNEDVERLYALVPVGTPVFVY
jgi:lipoprotein-anchoring transpeptidase ErfK/SrfK